MMKTILFLLAILSLHSFGDFNQWFVPPKGMEPSVVEGSIVVSTDKYGNEFGGTFSFDPKTGDLGFNEAFAEQVRGVIGKIAEEALKQALKSDEKINSVAKNLDALFATESFQITDGDGVVHTLNLPGTLKDALEKHSATISTKSDKAIVEVDGVTVEKNGEDKIQIKNVDQDYGDHTLSEYENYRVPIQSGKTTGLIWPKVGNLSQSNRFDNVTLSQNKSGKIEIKGFSDFDETIRGIFLPMVVDGKFGWDDSLELFDSNFKCDDDNLITLTGLAEAELGDLYCKIGDGAAGFMTVGEAMDATVASAGDALMADGAAGVYWGPVVSSVAVNGEEQPNESGAVDISGVAKSVFVNGTGPFYADANGVVDLGMLTASDGTNGTAAADGKSIFLKPPTADATAQYEIFGWSEDDSCSENLLDQLRSGVGSSSHEVLCRVGGPRGQLHYLPMTAADDRLPNPDTDDFKISSNGEKFSIKPGDSGKYLKSTGDGTTWGNAVSSIESGDTGKLTVSTDSDGKVTITPAGGGDVTVAGNQGGTAQSGQSIKFVSASDSNVKIWVEKSGNDIVVKIGVYYK